MHYSLPKLYEKTYSVENAKISQYYRCGKRLLLGFKCLRNVYISCICQWNYYYNYYYLFFIYLFIYLFIYFLSSTTFRVGLRTWFSDRLRLTVHVKFYASLLSTNCNMNRHWSKSLGFPLWWNIEENIKIKCINIKLSPPV